MSLLLWSLLGVCLITISLVICLPVSLHIRAGSKPARLQIGLGLMGGIVPVLRLVDTDRPRTKRAERRAKNRADKKTKRATQKKTRKRIDRMRVLRALPALIRDSFACFKIEDCQGEVRFGLPDPAETGQIYGYLIPVTLALHPRLQVIPDFNTACLIGDGSCTISVVPVRLVFPFMRFGWASLGPKR